MKSSQLSTVSPIFVAPRIRFSKGVAALFAAALAMGLGAQSALAQGPYYPQVAPLGGSPFIPNGFPVISNAELNLIETNMPAGKTLIIPPVAPKVAATLADYKAAVQATATYVANGLGGSVTLATLAAEVAKYRQSPPSQVGDGLGSIAAGVIASGLGNPAKIAGLQAAASAAAQADPANVVAGGALFQVLDKASKNGFEASVGAIANSAITGAAAGTPPPAALTSAGIRSLVGNAVSAITGNPGLTPAVKTTLVTGLPAAIMVNPLVTGSPANIDQASAALFANAATVTAGTMAGLIAAVVPASDVNYGAIAQGGLRSNPAAAATIGTALSSYSVYAQEITGSFTTFGPAFVPGSASAQTGTYSAAAIAAAGATKFGSSAPQVVKELLIATGAAGVAAQDIINRGVAGAIGSPAQNVATAAVGAGGASLADVTIGATTGAPIGSAGAVAKAVVLAGGLTGANATAVGDAAIHAVASISPANKPDAYSDVAYNLAASGGPLAFQQNAVIAEALAIAAENGGPATAPTYIAVVSAAAGSPANRAAILAAGTGAVAGDANADAASAAGVGLLGVLTNVPLANYQATLAAVTPGSSPAIDASNLAVLYAASLGNPGDAAGSLAAVIAKSGTSSTALTTAAVSASRSKQTGLTIAANVAVYAKANPTGDIQATIGHQILDNPTYVKEISVAATVVLPQYSHNIAHTVAFNQPKTASDAVGGIFLHSRITNTVGVAGVDKLTIGDRPAAGAAITAALATGILESTQLTAAERKTALQGAIVESVKALVNPLYNDATAGPAAFRASDGVTAASFTLVKAKGVAGGITGFVAQLVKPTDTAVVVNPSSDIYNALFQASYNAGVLTGTTYQLDIAQAAAQAFAWITGIAVSPAAVTDIANAVYNGYPAGGAAQLTKIQNAVAFGLTEGAGHVNAGAGAGGLRDGADPFYTHSSAQGKPVSNIFAL